MTTTRKKLAEVAELNNRATSNNWSRDDHEAELRKLKDAHEREDLRGYIDYSIAVNYGKRDASQSLRDEDDAALTVEKAEQEAVAAEQEEEHKTTSSHSKRGRKR